MFDITPIKIGPSYAATEEGVEYEYHSDLSDSDRLRITMDQNVTYWSRGCM